MKRHAKVVVLGSGLVGRAIALDLARDHEVTATDINPEALSPLARLGLPTKSTDFTNSTDLQKTIDGSDIVVSAVPGFMGFGVLQTVIGAGKDVVDISFFPEDPFTLDKVATANKVTAIVDCGVAPGMGNIILGYHHKHMEVQSYSCFVGGLPANPQWPYSYKAVFSPIDVIEEYTRPARFVAGGKLVTREALTDPEPVDFPGVGRLEAWNSDGLRTLLRTMPDIPNMIEKTLRYPGSMEAIKVLRHTGLLSKEEMTVDGVNVRPLDVTASLLFPLWKLKPGEEEFTAMIIRITGVENGKERAHEYRVLDRTHTASGTLSMARTTGYTCAAATNLVINKMFTRKGVCPPEFLGEDAKHYEFILDYLGQRDVIYQRS